MRNRIGTFVSACLVGLVGLCLLLPGCGGFPDEIEDSEFVLDLGGGGGGIWGNLGGGFGDIFGPLDVFSIGNQLDGPVAGQFDLDSIDYLAGYEDGYEAGRGDRFYHPHEPRYAGPPPGPNDSPYTWGWFDGYTDGYNGL